MVQVQVELFIIENNSNNYLMSREKDLISTKFILHLLRQGVAGQGHTHKELPGNGAMLTPSS
jgi:hypothetical protein